MKKIRKKKNYCPLVLIILQGHGWGWGQETKSNSLYPLTGTWMVSEHGRRGNKDYECIRLKK